MTERRRESTNSANWCSLRLRFDARELVLLRGAEHLRGAALARQARPNVLRSALTLARAGHKVGMAIAGQSVVLDEGEVRLLGEALAFAVDEIQWASRARPDDDASRRQSVLDAYPELVDRGLWRGFGLSREVETLGQRLTGALAQGLGPHA